MNLKIRVVSALLTAALLLLLAGCGGGYTCKVTFGSSTCNSSGSGISTGGGTGGGGGGGGGSATAFAYVIDQNGTLDGYELNTTAATFAAISGYTAPVIPTTDPGAGVVVAQQQFLYAVFPVAEQIFGWSIDASTGALTAVSGSPYSASFLGFVGISGFNQLSVITNPTGTLLFIADPGNGEIWDYQIGSAGALTLVAGSPFAAAPSSPPWNMTTDGLGKYLYTTDVDGTHEGLSIAAYTIGSSGTLTPVTGSPFPFPMWAVQGEPSGNYLIGTSGQTIAAGAGTDDKNLYVFNIQQSGATAGAISTAANSPFATINAPFNLAVQPNSANGEFVYSFSVNDTGLTYNQVEGYGINTTTGALTAISGSPFSGVTPSLWGQFDQSGGYLFLYGDASGNVQLAVTTVAPSTGVLTETLSPTTLPTTGYWAVTDP